MHAVNRKRNDARVVGRIFGTEDMNVRQRAESFHSTLRQFQLFFLDRIKSFFLQIPDRCGQPHRTGCIYRSRLKFLRNRCKNGSVAVNGIDHLASG